MKMKRNKFKMIKIVGIEMMIKIIMILKKMKKKIKIVKKMKMKTKIKMSHFLIQKVILQIYRILINNLLLHH